MPNERVVEIPWALSQLPQTGRILDVGSCDATYLLAVPGPDRQLECLDPRDCRSVIPHGVAFHKQSLFGNTLPPGHYDAVLLLSVLEHLGLPTYAQDHVACGDQRGLAECWRLLRPGGVLLATVPAGRPKVTSWYRQYSPEMLHRLFAGWEYEIDYWALIDGRFVGTSPEDVLAHDYRDRFDAFGGAEAMAAITARRG
jgi:SAM-dependent methyltransferase